MLSTLCVKPLPVLNPPWDPQRLEIQEPPHFLPGHSLGPYFVLPTNQKAGAENLV
jgi:hypothetical protein